MARTVREGQVTANLTEEGKRQLDEMRESSGLSYTKIIEFAVRKLYHAGDLDVTKSMEGR